jgi:hypothetical protein
LIFERSPSAVFCPENFSNRPVFGFAQGASFGDADAIAGFALVFFVVSFVPFGADYDFAVFGVGGAVFDRYHHGFVHFVADYYANSFFNCHTYLFF